jgi:hypothetical protein
MITNPRSRSTLQEILTDLEYRWQTIHLDPSLVLGLHFQHFSKFYHFILKSWRVYVRATNSKTKTRAENIFKFSLFSKGPSVKERRRLEENNS